MTTLEANGRATALYIATNRTFAEFVTRQPLDGLGSDVKTIQRMCADDIETLTLIDEALKNPHGVHHAFDNVHSTKPDGTSRQAALRSLRKNAPAIHKEVISGKLSAHAGMLKAGLRQVTSKRACRNSVASFHNWGIHLRQAATSR